MPRIPQPDSFNKHQKAKQDLALLGPEWENNRINKQKGSLENKNKKNPAKSKS